MLTKRQKVHGIIHAGSIAAAVVGAGLAQLPGSDAPVLVTIQVTMITAIAREHGAEMSRASAADLLLTFAACHIGRGVSELTIGWLPGLGNLINAATAASLTEAVGWAANAYLAATRGEA